MYTEARAALYRAQTRYMTETEEVEARSYADALLERLTAMRPLEAAEKAIVDEALERVMTRYPELSRKHGADTEQRGRRDMVFVYRYAALAMLLDDPDLVRDKVAVWMKTIVLSMMAKEPMVYGYQELIEAARRHLDEPTHKRLVPHIEVVLAELVRGLSRNHGCP